MATLDWSQCPAVESVPGKVSGAWLFRGTRMPVATVFENLEAGATIEEIMEWFDLTREQVTTVALVLASDESSWCFAPVFVAFRLGENMSSGKPNKRSLLAQKGTGADGSSQILKLFLRLFEPRSQGHARPWDKSLRRGTCWSADAQTKLTTAETAATLLHNCGSRTITRCRKPVLS